MAASGGGHLDTLQLLLSSQLPPGHTAVTAAAVAAAAAGHTATLEWLLAQETSCVTRAQKQSQADTGQQALVAAVAAGQLEVAELLLQLPAVSIHAPDTATGSTPLVAAARAGQRRAVDWVLRRGPALEQEAVRAAASLGHAPVLSLLLGQGAGAGAGHLQEAAAGGHLECVAALLEAAPALLDQADTEVCIFTGQLIYLYIVQGPQLW